MRRPPQCVGELLKTHVAYLKAKAHTFPLNDCLILLSNITGKSKEFLLAHPEFQLREDEINRFSAMVRRLRQGEPLAYLVGEKEFWGHLFICSPDTLIPRPETELLVELSIKHLDKRPPDLILDLGTGTGAVGISLLAHWKESKAILTDIDLSALLVARENCMRILGNVHRASFICCDWFNAFKKGFRADLITANPPYVSRRQMNLLDKSVREHEPERALFSRDGTGYSEIETILGNAHRHLAKGGLLLCEIGIGQAKRLLSFARSLDVYRTIDVVKDLSGIDRVIAASL